jgi:hypothetical protein
MASDAEYAQGVRDSQWKWREAYPDYSWQYRERHPEAVEEKRRLRNFAENKLASGLGTAGSAHVQLLVCTDTRADNN